jgi:hypothetical protein
MVGEVELALEVTKLLSTIASQVMDMLPNYEQSKRKEYFYLLKLYENERDRDYPLRDDNKVIQYRKELLRFLASFSKDLEQLKKEKQE